MGDRCLQAVLVLGLNGVCLLNKEQVVHHDDKGAKVDGVAAKRGKREHRLGKRGDRGNNTELKRAVHLRSLLAPLIPATPAARSTRPLAISTTAASVAYEPYVESRPPVAIPTPAVTRLAMPKTK